MSTPTTETPLTTEEVDAVALRLKQSNDDRRADKLTKGIIRAHDWRVQVWAQSELRIQRMNAELEAMGREQVIPFEPQFDTKEMLTHYAEMTLTK